MAKLIVTREGAVVGHFFVDQESFVIGRQPGCNLVLDDGAVSKQHAMIVSVANDQILEDQSTNGTLVNGVPVGKHILQNNDMIQIGNYVIKYMNQRAAREMDFDQTMMLSKEVLDAEMERAEAVDKPGEKQPGVSEARITGVKLPDGELRPLNGVASARAIQLTRVIHPLGLPEKCYAIILRRPHGFHLQPVVGSRAIKVNGQGVGDSQILLKQGDEIAVGSEIYSLNLR